MGKFIEGVIFTLAIFAMILIVVTFIARMADAGEVSLCEGVTVIETETGESFCQPSWTRRSFETIDTVEVRCAPWETTIVVEADGTVRCESYRYAWESE